MPDLPGRRVRRRRTGRDSVRKGGVRKCSPPSQPYKPEYELSRVTLELRTDALPTPCRQVLQLPRMSGMAKIFGLALESEIASLTDI